jgi:hypothetical protein
MMGAVRYRLLALVLLMSCAPTGGSAREAGERDSAPSSNVVTVAPVDLPAITTLRTRNHELTVYAAHDGLRFSVAQVDGTKLGDLLTQNELASRFPALHEHFSRAFAGEHLMLDASVGRVFTVPTRAHESAAERP